MFVSAPVLRYKKRPEEIQRKYPIIEELDTELKNMLLYADDKVVNKMGQFVNSPTKENFWLTALEMRKELYGIKTNLELSDFKV